MDARPAAVSAKALPLAQTDLLGDEREVVACAAVGWPPPVVHAEEGAHPRPEEPHAFSAIVSEPIAGACRDGHEARLAVLAAPHRDHPLAEIDVVIVKAHGFANAQPAGGDQTEQR